MRRFIFILILLAAASCNRYDPDEILLPRNDVSMTMSGAEIFSFKPLTCQMSHNTSTNEFRVFNENLSEWFSVRCHERPSDGGQELKADLTWTSQNVTKTMKDLTFRIEKIDKSGQIWMWCRQKSIGIVIKNL